MQEPLNGDHRSTTQQEQGDESDAGPVVAMPGQMVRTEAVGPGGFDMPLPGVGPPSGAAHAKGEGPFRWSGEAVSTQCEGAQDAGRGSRGDDRIGPEQIPGIHGPEN